MEGGRAQKFSFLQQNTRKRKGKKWRLICVSRGQRAFRSFLSRSIPIDYSFIACKGKKSCCCRHRFSRRPPLLFAPFSLVVCRCCCCCCCCGLMKVEQKGEETTATQLFLCFEGEEVYAQQKRAWARENFCV